MPTQDNQNMNANSISQEFISLLKIERYTLGFSVQILEIGKKN
jgi:hypothetical protein